MPRESWALCCVLKSVTLFPMATSLLRQSYVHLKTDVETGTRRDKASAQRYSVSSCVNSSDSRLSYSESQSCPLPYGVLWASQEALEVKNLPANIGNIKRCRFNPWVRKIPRRRAWQPTPVFLPGESHGQRSDGLQSIGLPSQTQLKRLNTRRSSNNTYSREDH